MGRPPFGMGCVGSSATRQHDQVRQPREPATVEVIVTDSEPPPVSSSSFHGKYLLLRKIGKGAFAQVYLAADSSSSSVPVAVKIIDLRPRSKPGSVASEEVNAKALKSAENEAAVLRLVGRHRSCVCMLEHFLEDFVFYVVMERCKLTLLQHLERVSQLTEQAMCPLFRDMAEALTYVHGLGVVHRDVKPDNFLCSGPEATVKLCDFGLAEVLVGDNQLNGVYGTAPFMSPEMVQGNGYTTPTDVWSLGVLMYALLLGHFPYQPSEANAKAMKVAILAGIPAPSFDLRGGLRVGGVSISEQLRTLLKALLHRTPSRRLTAAQAVEHRWMQGQLNPTDTGPQSFRPMLYSAKRVGAFDIRPVVEDMGRNSLDDILLLEQAKLHPDKGGAAAIAAAKHLPMTGSRKTASLMSPDLLQVSRVMSLDGPSDSTMVTSNMSTMNFSRASEVSVRSRQGL